MKRVANRIFWIGGIALVLWYLSAGAYVAIYAPYWMPLTGITLSLVFFWAAVRKDMP